MYVLPSWLGLHVHYSACRLKTTPAREDKMLTSRLAEDQPEVTAYELACDAYDAALDKAYEAKKAWRKAEEHVLVAAEELARHERKPGVPL
jgi:hypothetical protein